MKKPKLSLKTKSYYKTRCDKLFSAKTRAIGFCQWCKTHNKSTLQCAHIISRSNLKTRWDSLNVLCLCASCHFKAHREPLAFSEWFLTEYPERANYLRTARLEIKKMSIGDYQELYEQLKEGGENV